MNVCPNQHPVEDGLTYCEECGSRVAGAAPPPADVSESAVAQTWACPECATVQTMSRYCEACGEPNINHPKYIAPLLPEAALDDEPAMPTTSTVGATAPGASEAKPSVSAKWTVVAQADKTYFDKMQALEGPDASAVQFPTVYPSRKFELTTEQVFIGRRSRSRGIEPDIDLSAAPEDSGVSHAHAAIVSTVGGWSIIDVGSANGTYLNEGTQPIAANVPVVLSEGDRIHLGAFTTLTIENAT